MNNHKPNFAKATSGKQEAIIVAMPDKFFKEYTMEKFLRDVENMNTKDNFVWYLVRKTLFYL